MRVVVWTLGGQSCVDPWETPQGPEFRPPISFSPNLEMGALLLPPFYRGGREGSDQPCGQQLGMRGSRLASLPQNSESVHEGG